MPRHGRSRTPPAQPPRTPQYTPPATARSGPAHTSAPDRREILRCSGGSTERQLHRLRTHGFHPVSQDALSRRYTPAERRAHQRMAAQVSARCTLCTPHPAATAHGEFSLRFRRARRETERPWRRMFKDATIRIFCVHELQGGRIVCNFLWRGRAEWRHLRMRVRRAWGGRPIAPVAL
jgi:hypothetical protein